MLKRAGETDLGILEEHENSLSPHLAETLPVLLKGGNLLHIPTNVGWSQTLVGSGSVLQIPALQGVGTGVAPNSSALLFMSMMCFAQGIGNYSRMNWNKKISLVFVYLREVSDAQVVARLQLKEAVTIGALAAKGMGVKVLNFALWGESYGTALGEIDLGITLNDTYEKQVVIFHDPGVPKIEWYVDGVLKGTQSTAAYIPSGGGGASCRLVHSIANGAGGGSDAWSEMAHPKIWQAR